MKQRRQLKAYGIMMLPATKKLLCTVVLKRICSAMKLKKNEQFSP